MKHWCFFLPIDERTTRVFFAFYFGSIKIPFLPVMFPRWMQSLVMRFARRAIMVPLLRQDGFAVEAEQEAYERHFNAPQAELNPAVLQFQQLTINKWEAYLARSRASSDCGVKNDETEH